jgi:hypothetical protein
MTGSSDFPRPSPCGTHHCTPQGSEAYCARFSYVGKFHLPGFAPACDGTGWCHIGLDGKPAYQDRFEKVWGFYCKRAAAKEPSGWTHITPSGERAYDQRYPWVGNFQEDLCPVQDADGFHHIHPDGHRPYSENFAYAGDFRDGAAVVISKIDGLSRHISPSGSRIHDKEFIELDVFHKGFARARDSAGWFHIKTDGLACYPARFKFIEPFYNDAALAHTMDDIVVRISPEGKIVNRIGSLPMMNPSTAKESGADGVRAGRIKVLITGNIGSGKSTLAALITRQLGWSHESIDRYRQLFSDGSPAGEALAWSHFLAHAQSASNSIYECSGAGPNRHLLAQALTLSKVRIVRVGLQAAPATCARRVVGRRWETPYPFNNLPDPNILEKISSELDSIWADGTYFLIPETDSPTQAMSKLVRFLDNELT